MFYDKLKKSKRLEQKDKIKEFLLRMNAKRVSPLLISKNFPGFDENEVLSIIFELVSEDFLNISYEVTCPECSADVELVHSLNDIPERLSCDICGYEFEPCQSNIWIVVDLKSTTTKKKNILKTNNTINTDLPVDKVLLNEEFQNLSNKDFYNPNISKLRELYNNLEKTEGITVKRELIQEFLIQLFSSIQQCRVDSTNSYIVIENQNSLNTILQQMGHIILITFELEDNVDVISKFGRDLNKKNLSSGIFIFFEDLNHKKIIELNKLLSSFLDNGISIYFLTCTDIEEILQGKNLLQLLREKDKNLHLMDIHESVFDKLYNILFTKTAEIPSILLVFFASVLSFTFGQNYPYIYYSIISFIFFIYSLTYVMVKFNGIIRFIMVFLILIIFVNILFYIENINLLNLLIEMIK